MYILVKYLKALKPRLRQLCRERYEDLHNKVVNEQRKLHWLQLENLNSPHEDILAAELSQHKLVHELIVAEEMMLRQKSRIQWIKEGDRNTSFFIIWFKKNISRSR